MSIAWKVPKFVVFSGLNKEKHGPKETPYLDTFHAVVKHRYSSFGKIWFIEVIGKICKISTLLKLVIDILLPCTTFKTKVHWECIKHSYKGIEKWENEKSITSEKNIKDQKENEKKKEKYYRDPESRRKYRKRKKENPQQEKYYIWKKRNIRKILN